MRTGAAAALPRQSRRGVVVEPTEDERAVVRALRRRRERARRRPAHVVALVERPLSHLKDAVVVVGAEEEVVEVVEVVAAEVVVVDEDVVVAVGSRHLQFHRQSLPRVLDAVRIVEQVVPALRPHRTGRRRPLQPPLAIPDRAALELEPVEHPVLDAERRRADAVAPHLAHPAERLREAMEAVRTWRWWWQQWRPVTCTASRSPMIFSVKSCHGLRRWRRWR